MFFSFPFLLVRETNSRAEGRGIKGAPINSQKKTRTRNMTGHGKDGEPNVTQLGGA